MLRLHRTRSTIATSIVVSVTALGGCREEPTTLTPVHDIPVEALVETPWWMEQSTDDSAPQRPILERNPFDQPGQSGLAGSVVTHTTSRHAAAGQRLPKPPPVELQGIIAWSENVRAVIDGRQYKIGEIMKHRGRHWRIVAINEERRSVSIRWTDGEEAVDATIYQAQDDS